VLHNVSDEPVDVPCFERSAELPKGVLEIVEFVLKGVDEQILFSNLHSVQDLLAALSNVSKLVSKHVYIARSGDVLAAYLHASQCERRACRRPTLSAVCSTRRRRARDHPVCARECRSADFVRGSPYCPGFAAGPKERK